MPNTSSQVNNHDYNNDIEHLFWIADNEELVQHYISTLDTDAKIALLEAFDDLIDEWIGSKTMKKMNIIQKIYYNLFNDESNWILKYLVALDENIHWVIKKIEVLKYWTTKDVVISVKTVDNSTFMCNYSLNDITNLHDEIKWNAKKIAESTYETRQLVQAILEFSQTVWDTPVVGDAAILNIDKIIATLVTTKWKLEDNLQELSFEELRANKK